MKGRQFDITKFDIAEDGTGVGGFVRTTIESIFCVDGLRRVYSAAIENRTPANFFGAALNALGVSVNLAPLDLQQVPVTGATVVIANHPFGGLDGVILGALMSSIR